MGNKISDKELKSELRRLKAEIGRVPRTKDMREKGKYGYGTYRRRFGSWNNALKAVGFESNKEQSVSNQDFIDEIHRLKNKLDRIPRAKDMLKQGNYSTSQYQRRFGSWNRALETSGLEVNQNKSISDQELIDELNSIQKAVERTPTYSDIQNHAAFSVSTFKNHFGSYRNALKAAGFKSNKKFNIPKEELRSDLRRVADELDKSPTPKEYNTIGKYSTSTLERSFESWTGALNSVGLEPNRHFNATKDELLADLKDIAQDLERTPTGNDVTKHGKYGYNTYKRKFGTWNDALRAAELTTNKEMNVSREELSRELERLAEILNRVPRMKDMRAHGQYSIRPYRREFGSWNDAIRYLNLDVNSHHNISDSDLLNELSRLANVLEKTPTSGDIQSKGKYSRSVYQLRFGSLHAALDMIGLTPGEGGSYNRISTEDLLDNLVQIREDLERVPSAEDLDEHGKYSRRAYQSRFGSWNDAIKAAGFEPYETPTGKDHWRWRGGEAPYGDGWNEAKRETVRERDNRTCQNCGRSEEEHLKNMGRNTLSTISKKQGTSMIQIVGIT